MSKKSQFIGYQWPSFLLISILPSLGWMILSLLMLIRCMLSLFLLREWISIVSSLWVGGCNLTSLEWPSNQLARCTQPHWAPSVWQEPEARHSELVPIPCTETCGASQVTQQQWQPNRKMPEHVWRVEILWWSFDHGHYFEAMKSHSLTKQDPISQPPTHSL